MLKLVGNRESKPSGNNNVKSEPVEAAEEEEESSHDQSNTSKRRANTKSKPTEDKLSLLAKAAERMRNEENVDHQAVESMKSIKNPAMSRMSPSPHEHTESSSPGNASTHQALIQLLSQQLNAAAAATSRTAAQPAVVLNLEDVLNVILNAASIVTSNNAAHRAGDEAVNCEAETELATGHQYDEIAQMSLLSSNDFCSQYKKRIQQAEERLMQKKQLDEQEKLAKQQRKSRKRSQSSLSVNVGVESNEETNQMSAVLLLSKALESNANKELIKLILLSDLSSSNQALNETEHKQLQLILSSLQEEQLKQVGESSSMTQQMDAIGDEVSPGSHYTNESLLNYPPKKRHRIQQQQHEQFLIHQQKQQLLMLETEAGEAATAMSENSHVEGSTAKQRGVECAKANGQEQPAHVGLNAHVLSASSCYSMSTSSSPLSSPSIFTDSVSSSSSNGINLSNHLNKIEANQSQVN